MIDMDMDMTGGMGVMMLCCWRSSSASPSTSASARRSHASRPSRAS